MDKRHHDENFTSRKGVANPKKYFVCKHHFKADYILISLGIGRKNLKLGVTPSAFNFRNPGKIKPRKSPKKRLLTSYK